jgi:Flp pilus assembly protein TadB
VLAFGLSLAVGRYEGRRAAAVTEANAIGTTYLRAQTLAEPVRSESLELLERFTDTSVRISHERPGSAAQRRTVASSRVIERRLWALADQAMVADPVASAPRLYVETLNGMFDAQTSRVAGLGNRVPTTVLLLEVTGAALALGMLAVHLSVLGQGLLTSVLAAALVGLTLFVTFDLDRPTRGFIEVPSTALDHVRQSIALGPSADGPGGP